MSKEMYVSSSPHETKVAVLEDDQLVEVHFERDTDVGLVGGIYKGRVSRVLPGMQSAFVDIGLDRDAFLYVSDFFYEDQEEFDKVFEEAEARATKLTTRTAETPAAPPSAVATEPSAPVVGQAVEPPVTPLEAPAPAAPIAVPSAPPTPVAGPPMAAKDYVDRAPVAKDYTERRPYDPRREDPRRGRRRRHRGRPEFGANRHEDRRFPPSHHVEEPITESHTFEILPGESLAKYSHAGRGTLSEPPAEAGAATPEVTVPDNLSGTDDDFASIHSPVVQAYEMSEKAAPESAAEASDAESLPPNEAQAPAAAVTDVVTDAMEPLSPAVTEASAVPSDAESLASDNAEVSVASLPARAEEPAPVAPPLSAPVAPVTESQRELEIPAAPSSPSFEAEVAASYSVEEIAGPSSGEPEPDAPVIAANAAPAASETESAPAIAAPETAEVQSATELGGFGEDEVEDEDDEVSDDEELLEAAQTEDLPEGIEPESSAEGEPGAESESPEGVAAAAEGQPSAQEGAPAGAPTNGDPGEPGERTYTLREPHQRPRFAPPRRRRGRRDGRDGGRRFDKPRESSRAGNHAPVQIAEVLKEGQEILVQIAKEPLGTKGARITSHVALPGRYLVYMPTTEHIGVSRKIASEEERLRLRNIIQENKGSLTGGFIVRTAGQGRPEEEFKADLNFLGTLWAEIRAKAERLRAPALLHRDLNLVQRLLRDLLTPDFKSVRVDNEIDYERVLEFVNRCQPALVGKVKLYTRDTPLYEEFGIQQEIEKALKPKVWLKSGGYIVINQTEALVAIDVNTGKYVGKTNRLEDTIVRTNIDAVNEIVRQVRLRDLGGIIVIDFIDMDERKNRAKVVQALEEALRSDRAPTKVISFNDFGLVAVTRKRVKQSLERALCQPCDYCTGSGWVKSVNTVCNEILAEARKMAKQIDGNVITLRVNPEVAKALKSREGGLVSELESLTKKDVIIKGDPSVHQERFEIF